MSDYNPSDHTVDEVKAYVEEHPDEAVDVLEAEQADKDRSTLVEWLNKEIEASGVDPDDPNTYPTEDDRLGGGPLI